MSNEWRICKRWKHGRALSILRGKLCICSHCTAIFSLNGNIKTARVSPILCRWGSFQHHKRNMECTSNQCLDQGLWGTRFSINMYILILTPVHQPSWPYFFSFLFKDSVWLFFLFSPPALPEARESLQSVFKGSAKICILYFPESPLFPPRPAAYAYTSPPFFTVILQSSCCFCSSLVNGFFSSRALFQSSTINWLFLLLILPFILTFTFSFSFPH